MPTNAHSPFLYRLLFTLARRLVVDSPPSNESPVASAPMGLHPTYEVRHATARRATHAFRQSED